MSVRIRNLQSNSGTPVPLNFTDEFNAVAGAYLGDNWNVIADPTNGLSGPNVDVNINVAGGNLVIGDGSATNFNAGRVWMYPSKVNYAKIEQITRTPGRGVFSQITLNSVSAGVGSVLVFCLGQTNTTALHGYSLSLDASTTNVDLNGHGVVFAAACMVRAPGDVIRLEVRFGTAAINLRAFQNGILRANVDDNTGGRITDGGCYGLYWQGSTTAQWSIDRYTGGVL